MGDPNEIADLHVARNTEAQEILHPRFAEGIRDQPRVEERGQASRFATYCNSLHPETRMYLFDSYSSPNKDVILLF